MRDNGPSRGASRGIATGRGPDPDTILGRGEMMAAGISPAELPFFRDWCREHLTPVYFRMDEPVARTKLLIEHVEAYAKELALTDADRAEKLSTPMRAAKEAHRLHEAVLQRYRLKKLPTMPDPRTTGSVPTEAEDEEPAPRARMDAPEPEESWDEMPKPRPQGMRALPKNDTPIPPRPPSTNRKAVEARARRAKQGEAREKMRAERKP